MNIVGRFIFRESTGLTVAELRSQTTRQNEQTRIQIVQKIIRALAES
jgi:hypothetical protein